jgi:Lhr-like helicase
MQKMSNEQRNVLQYIRAGHNVVVDACAGSGK